MYAIGTHKDDKRTQITTATFLQNKVENPPKLLEYTTDEVLKLDKVLSQQNIENMTSLPKEKQNAAPSICCTSKHVLLSRKAEPRPAYPSNPRTPLTIPKSLPRSSIIGLRAIARAFEKTAMYRYNLENKLDVKLEKKPEDIHVNKEPEKIQKIEDKELLQQTAQEIQIKKDASTVTIFNGHEDKNFDTVSTQTCLQENFLANKNVINEPIIEISEENSKKTVNKMCQCEYIKDVPVVKNVRKRFTKKSKIPVQNKKANALNYNGKLNANTTNLAGQNNDVHLNKKCNTVKTLKSANKNYANLLRNSIMKSKSNWKNKVLSLSSSDSYENTSMSKLNLSRHIKNLQNENVSSNIHKNVSYKILPKWHKSINKQFIRNSSFRLVGGGNAQTRYSKVYGKCIKKLLDTEISRQNLNILAQCLEIDDSDLSVSFLDELKKQCNSRKKILGKKLITLYKNQRSRSSGSSSEYSLKENRPKQKSKNIFNSHKIKGNQINDNIMLNKNKMKKQNDRNYTKINYQNYIEHLKHQLNSDYGSISDDDYKIKQPKPELHKLMSKSDIELNKTKSINPLRVNENFRLENFFNKLKISDCKLASGDEINYLPEDLVKLVNENELECRQNTKLNYTLIKKCQQLTEITAYENNLAADVEVMLAKVEKYVEYMKKCEELFGISVTSTDLRLQIDKIVNEISENARKCNSIKKENDEVKKVLTEYEQILLDCNCIECKCLRDDITKLEGKIKKVDIFLNSKCK